MDDFIHLVQQAQSGDAEAFAALVARFQNLAYAYAYAILGDFDLAQDVAQEAFIEAYQCLPGLRVPLAFPAWLKRMVYKYCDRITRRKSYLTIPLEAIEQVGLSQPGPSERAERDEVRRQLNEALQTIPADLRTAAILFYVSGYTYQEIADFLGVPVKTVKSRLHTSRQRLKERMLSMVQDEFEHNPLPEQFTRETVEQALRRASELNENRHYDEAEALLRSLLVKVPENPAALKALNRAVMRGRVYGQGRWDLLSELATRGKMILKTSGDEEIHRQVAQTLLAIPAMPEAISFLASWITEKGPALDRLGMLAWARGCSGDFAAALTLWNALFDFARTRPDTDVLGQLPFIAYTLVDCLSDAGELTSAQAVARQAWARCAEMGPLPAQGTLRGDGDWLLLWRTAGLDPNEIAPVLLARHPESADPAARAAFLAVRGWLDAPEAVAAAWLDWARDLLSAANFSLLEKYRNEMLPTLRRRGAGQAANQLARNVWGWLGTTPTPEAQQARVTWDWERYNPVVAIDARDWQAAEALVRAEIQARGVQGAVGWAAIVMGGSGSPSPVEIMQALRENGVSRVDEYGMFGWYLMAREAAHAGDADQAFDALRKALSYWSNKPYWITDLWEQDAYWGDLRQHPAFKQVFDQRRQRIGAIYGWLHYFPGW